VGRVTPQTRLRRRYRWRLRTRSEPRRLRTTAFRLRSRSQLTCGSPATRQLRAQIRWGLSQKTSRSSRKTTTDGGSGSDLKPNQGRTRSKRRLDRRETLHPTTRSAGGAGPRAQDGDAALVPGGPRARHRRRPRRSGATRTCRAWGGRAACGSRWPAGDRPTRRRTLSERRPRDAAPRAEGEATRFADLAAEERSAAARRASMITDHERIWGRGNLEWLELGARNVETGS
jgi:hypothetical protein